VYGIRYFPKKKGVVLLFRKNGRNKTPLQYACIPESRREEVIKIVEKILADYRSAANGNDDDDDDNDDDEPYNIVDASL
jgi:hypothetical protein